MSKHFLSDPLDVVSCKSDFKNLGLKPFSSGNLFSLIGSLPSDRSYKARIVRSILLEFKTMSHGQVFLFDAPFLSNYKDCSLSFLRSVLKICRWYRKLGFSISDLSLRVQVLSNGFMIDNKRIFYSRVYASGQSSFTSHFICISSPSIFVDLNLNKGCRVDFFPPLYDFTNE